MANWDSTTSLLETRLRSLRAQWEATKAVWDDPVQRSFEKEHLEPLAHQTEATLRSMEQLARIIEKAQRSVK